MVVGVVVLASILHVEDVGHFRKDGVRQVDDHRLFVIVSSTASIASGEKERVKQSLCLVQVLGDSSVVVEAEDFGVWVKRQIFCVFNVAFSFAVRWREVGARWRELVVILEDPFVEVILEEDLDEDSVV